MSLPHSFLNAQNYDRTVVRGIALDLSAVLFARVSDKLISKFLRKFFNLVSCTLLCHPTLVSVIVLLASKVTILKHDHHIHVI